MKLPPFARLLPSPPVPPRHPRRQRREHAALQRTLRQRPQLVELELAIAVLTPSPPGTVRTLRSHLGRARRRGELHRVMTRWLEAQPGRQPPADERQSA